MLQALRDRSLETAGGRDWNLSVWEDITHDRMLNPPLSEEDLAGAMVGHFPPEVQNGMICGNLKTTQDALAYLSNLQALEIMREHMRRPRRDYDERDTNTRPLGGENK
jgi:hypothetical protein